METAQKTLIGLLVLAVVIVGYFIYVDKSTDISAGESSTTQQNIAETGPRTTKNGTSTNFENNKGSMVNVEKLLTLNPGSNATTEQLKSFALSVSSYAIDTTSVDVTSCSPNPAVSRVTMKKNINFVNSDSVAHKLINGKITIEVPAKGSKQVSPAFPGPGIYGYSCDTKMAGIFLVMP
ncbi:MAG: hypothetical protein WAX44_00030 [Minisyncoccia bacterium]